MIMGMGMPRRSRGKQLPYVYFRTDSFLNLGLLFSLVNFIPCCLICLSVDLLRQPVSLLVGTKQPCLALLS